MVAWANAIETEATALIGLGDAGAQIAVGFRCSIFFVEFWFGSRVTSNRDLSPRRCGFSIDADHELKRQSYLY